MSMEIYYLYGMSIWLLWAMAAGLAVPWRTDIGISMDIYYRHGMCICLLWAMATGFTVGHLYKYMFVMGDGCGFGCTMEDGHSMSMEIYHLYGMSIWLLWAMAAGLAVP